MSAPKYSAKIGYGSLPVVKVDDPFPIPDTDDIQVLGWAIHGFRKGLRLTLAHRGALFHVVLYRDAQSREAEPTFCQRIFDGVEDSWHASSKAANIWSDRDSYSFYNHAGYSVIVQLEDELFELVRRALPHLLESAAARRQGSLAGSQLWIELGADVDAAGRPRLTLVGDIFRELMNSDLPLLSYTDFPHVPRHDLSAVDSYIRVIADTICIVAGQRLSSDHSHQLALKTMFAATDHSEKLQQSRHDFTDLFIGELKVLTSVPPHPNVMPSPLALLTVPDQQQARLEASNEGEVNKASRLVGWLQPVLTEFNEFLRRSKDMSAERRLKYAYQLCCGVRHLFKHGFCHSDLGLQNALIAGLHPDDRVIVMDFEPIQDYHNKNGPTAPEVDGHWIVSNDGKEGSVTYSHCDAEPVWVGDAVHKDWERMPEALERLTIFSIGSMLSILLNVRVVFPWTHDYLRRNIQLQQAAVVGADPKRDAWEASMPIDIRDLVQRCCAYDPRERPLLDDVVEQLKKFATL